MCVGAALCNVSRHIREDWSIRIVTGVTEGQEHLNRVLLIAFWEHLNENFTAQNAVGRELTNKHLVIITCQSVRESSCVFVPSDEPAITKLTFHLNVASSVEVVRPCCRSRYNLYCGLCGTNGIALNADGHPAVIGQLREETEKCRVDSVWSNIRTQ